MLRLEKSPGLPINATTPIALVGSIAAPISSLGPVHSSACRPRAPFWNGPLSRPPGGGLTAADQKLFDNYAEQKCPACLKKRKLASESAQQRQQYKDWCLP